ncbi:MAG: hypothetical protein KatS3mg090_0473 [Patescibacteria group bacterium]|nr:MAG: hypothetical protein KatS3mg090_0473 [Patescibacteria group bacterium]
MNLLDLIKNSLDDKEKQLAEIICTNKSIEKIIKDIEAVGILNFKISKHDNQENSKNR